MFTIFESAPGQGGTSLGGRISPDMGGEDFSFTDDFDMGGAEYGVDENVLDLSEAEAEGFGPASVAAGIGAADLDFSAPDTGGMDEFDSHSGPDDFELDLSGIGGEPATASVESEAPEADQEISLDIGTEATTDAEIAVDSDFGGEGFDSEVEGLGFGFDENPEQEIALDTESEASLEPEGEISMDLELPGEETAEDEISMDLELPGEETAEDEISMDLELPAEDGGEEASLELGDEPEMDMGEISLDESSLDAGGEEEQEFDLAGMDEETDLALDDDLGGYEESLEEEEETGSVDFDLDNVDLDAPEEEVSFEEEPAAMETTEEPGMEFDGLELEMESPAEPEEEEPQV